MRYPSLFAVLLIVWAGVSVSQPVVLESSPPFIPEGKALEGLVITLDAGHGGSAHQPGYTGSARGVESRVVEENLNMRVAAELYHHLKAAGATVHMTRWDDRKVTLGDTGRADELGARTAVAQRTASHLFLSIHHNAAPRVTADGVVILIWPTDSHGADQPLETAFARCLNDAVAGAVPHAEPFASWVNKHPLVAGVDVPSAVVEIGFLTNPDFDAWVSQPGSHRAAARGVYHGVVRMWAEHREALQAKRAQLFPQAADPQESSGAKRPPMWRHAQQLWPFDTPPTTPAHVQHVLDLYRKTVLNDASITHLSVTAEGGPGQWRLTGTATHPLQRAAVGNLIQAVTGEPVSNDITLLPAKDLGEKRYGVVQIPVALTYTTPRMGGTPATQLLLGERVWLLDVSEDGAFLLHQAADGYVGWVRREAIHRLAADDFEAWIAQDRAMLTQSHRADDLRLPAGAALPIVKVGEDTALLRLPIGVRATHGDAQVEVPLGSLRLPADQDLGRDATLIASRFLTTPYIFGGRNGGQGIDCSGLSGIAYQAAGIRLPRDARQQVLVGEVVATAWSLTSLQPGDLVFFINTTGRVSHMGISLGGLRFIHASPPEVHVSSLDPEDALYSPRWAKRFVVARRVAP